jgi:hypothetical protein
MGIPLDPMAADWTTVGRLAIALESREHGPMTDDIEAEGKRFLSDFANADSAGRGTLRKKGQDLARRLRSAAIDLSSGKATEFSPDIPKLILLAAKVAYVAFDKAQREIEPFERDVYYYSNLTPPDPIVAAYDAFKRTGS